MWDMAALRSAGSAPACASQDIHQGGVAGADSLTSPRPFGAEFLASSALAKAVASQAQSEVADTCGSGIAAGIASRRRYVHMRKPLLLAATAAATATLVLGPAAGALAAPVHDVLTVAKVGGPNVKVNAVLQAGLKAKTVLVFAAVTGTPISLKCTTSTITSKVTANPAKPGTAVQSLTKETVAGCKANTTLVKSVTVTVTKLPNKVTVSDATGFPVTVFGPSASLKIVTTIIGTITCKYSAKTIKGHASNTGSLISFSKQVFNRATGSNANCPTKGALTATYGPVVDLSVVGHPHVFVN
jgi:hypothetical protein